jgi:hypothetical protein
LVADLLGVVKIDDKNAAQKLTKSYAGHQQKWSANLKEEQEKAEAMEAKVEKDEVRAKYYDLGEVLLKSGLVVTSITLLTRSWHGRGDTGTAAEVELVTYCEVPRLWCDELRRNLSARTSINLL